jgi:hypothetical protein
MSLYRSLTATFVFSMSLQEMLQQCLEIGHTFHYHPDIRSYIAYIASTFLTPYSDVVGYQSFQGPC